MSKEKFKFFFDLGSSKIRTAAIDFEEISNNLYFESSFIPDEKHYENEIHNSILNIEKKTGEFLKTTDVMLDDKKTFSVSIGMKKKHENKIISNDELKFMVNELKKEVSKNYLEYDILHIIIKNLMIDDKEYYNLPDFEINHLKIELLFIFIPKSKKKLIKEIFKKKNVLIRNFFCSSYLKSLHYIKNLKNPNFTIFIDMGFNKTSIIVYKNSRIKSFDIIEAGGNNISKDLAKILKIKVLDAEKIKCLFDDNFRFIKSNNLDLELIKNIIFSRVEELLEISFEIVDKKFRISKINNDLTKFILLGEGSKVLDNVFKDKILFNKEIHLMEETYIDICNSIVDYTSSNSEIQEVKMINPKNEKLGFFERFFHLFSR